MNLINDPIIHLSKTLHSVLQLYLEGYGNKFFISRTNLDFFPTTQFLNKIKEVKVIIDQNDWNKYFPNNLNDGKHERIIKNFFVGFDRLTSQSNLKLINENITVKSVANINEVKIYGGDAEKLILERIIKLLLNYRELYEIILLNGSIGSGDYKPGWSDIDLFVVLKRTTIESEFLLKKARKIALRLKREIYNYSILQLHGVFYSTIFNFQYHVNNLFPIKCFESGLAYSNCAVLKLSRPQSCDAATNYFYRDIYRSSKLLISKLNDLDHFQKVLLIHRIYSFPFAFLECQGIQVYKRESFKEISSNFSSDFLSIVEFYEKVNQFYYRWQVNMIKTTKIRSLFKNIVKPEYLNRIFLSSETEILDNISGFFEFLINENLTITFENYLSIAKIKVFGIYND